MRVPFVVEGDRETKPGSSVGGRGHGSTPPQSDAARDQPDHLSTVLGRDVASSAYRQVLRQPFDYGLEATRDWPTRITAPRTKNYPADRFPPSPHTAFSTSEPFRSTIFLKFKPWWNLPTRLSGLAARSAKKITGRCPVAAAAYGLSSSRPSPRPTASRCSGNDPAFGNGFAFPSFGRRDTDDRLGQASPQRDGVLNAPFHYHR